MNNQDWSDTNSASVTQKMLNLYKPLGVTPLQLIEAFRRQHPEYETISLGYAGRLDPMAEGILVVLIGDENNKRKEYERLPKEYEFDVLLGIETDTYDTLGLVKQVNIPHKDFPLQSIQNLLPSFVGEKEQPYPPYSSPRVNGKPLFYWARENRLDEITIPTKKITIYSLEMISHKTITAQELLTLAIDRTDLVTGEFRQAETCMRWQKALENLPVATYFPVITICVSCSSGTYVRSLSHEIGEKLGIGALALKIVRTKVGDLTLANAVRIKV